LRDLTTEKTPDVPMTPTMATPKTPAAKRLLLPWLVATKRRRGRPAVSEDITQRARHIECAALMLMTEWPVRRVAASFGISRKTAYLWLKLALSYEGAKSETLRQLVAKRKSKPKRRR
jgi:hypothetical protein